MNSRRGFLLQSSIALLAGSGGAAASAQSSTDATPGAPPAFNTSPPVGPAVTAATFAEGEKLMQVELTPPQQAMAAESWRTMMAPLLERRTGPRKVELPSDVAPWSNGHAVLPGQTAGPRQNRFIRTKPAAGRLPTSEDDIAFAPVTSLSQWIQTRQLTSERLTELYLARLQHFDPKLHCVITLTRDHALALARAADREIAGGQYRGPLHGIPWGAKDLLDTANIATTYGAEPFRDRVPQQDAAVVKRLQAAGAVLVAKLSLGALALNDIWSAVRP